MGQNLSRLMCLLAISMMAISLSAQNAQDMLRRRAAQKVGQMCDYIEFMANPQNEIDVRKYYCSAALNLFINKGNPYTENGREKKGVLMEVTSVNRANTVSRLIRSYFNGLMNLKYSKVEISTTDVSNIRVSNLKRIGENSYVCTCYFEQAFCGYKDGVPVYKDITRKRVQCYVIAEQTEDGVEYIVLLGDVTAIDTRRL